MIDIVYAPIGIWPDERKTPRRSPFSATWESTKALLDHELRQIGAEALTIKLDVQPSQIKINGQLKKGTNPLYHGVILEFDADHGHLVYPCDEFFFWRHNVRALARGFAALRQLERDGVARHGQQYTGWKELAPAKDGLLEARILLANEAGLSLDEQKTLDLTGLYRMAVKASHPDSGGSDERFSRVQEAYRLLRS